MFREVVDDDHLLNLMMYFSLICSGIITVNSCRLDLAIIGSFETRIACAWCLVVHDLIELDERMLDPEWQQGTPIIRVRYINEDDEASSFRTPCSHPRCFSGA